MNDKNRRIDEFLKYLRDIILQNPSLTLKHNTIYHELTRLGVPDNERNEKLNQHFDEWIQHFRNEPNCNVFVAPNWNYFCQFISSDQLAYSTNEHLKIYVPLDSDHIERGAKEIFEFLSSEEISHASKIGSHVRFDDIVVRIINPEDLTKFLNFLNNNKYIREGLMPANPFAFNLNGIPMAVDGHLSYNSTVTSLILIYINEKINAHALDTIGVEDFYNFVQRYYNYVFSSAYGLEKLISDFEIKVSINDTIVNYKNVFELILKSRNESFTFENYIEHYTKCADPNLQNDKLAQIEVMQSVHQKSFDNDIVIQKTNKMLLEIIDGMVEKYKDQYGVLNNINKYIIYGDLNYITRHNNLRDKVANSTFREDLSQIMKNNGISFMDYAQSVLKERKDQSVCEKNEDKPYSTIEKSVILTIQEILAIMSKKYGVYVANENLVEFIASGDPARLTRDSNLRDRVVNSTFRMDLKEILDQRHVSMEDYLKVVSNVIVAPSEVYLEQAILKTYSKYEKKYQEGISSLKGTEFIISALVQLVKNGEYTGFTRDNGVRMNLQNNVSVAEVINIIKRTLGIDEQQDLDYHEIRELMENYVSVVIQNNNVPQL